MISLIGCQPKEKTKIIIISPSDTQSLFSNNQVQILAKTEPPIDITKKINAKIEYILDDESITIAEGDIRSFAALDRIQAFWDISDVPEDEYLIKVSMDGAISDEVVVTINQPPSTDIGLESVESSTEGSNVHLTAIVDPTVSKPIDKYIWTAGDDSAPSVTESPDFIHNYPPGDTFLVWLETHDTLGGADLITRDLFLIQDGGQIVKTTDCGCTSMTITAGGNTKTYCIPTVIINGQQVVHPRALNELTQLGCNAIGNAGTGGCPANQVPINCPLGQRNPEANQPKLAYGFEVEADLTDNTNDITKCPEGQYGRGTIKINGFLAPNPVVAIPPPSGAQTLPKAGGVPPFGFNGVAAGNPYPPYAGPNYGSDDYANPFTFKRHLPGAIRWFDAPNLTIPQGTNSVERSNEFISYVRGTPTCWCRFKVIQNWTRANGAAAGNTVEILDGLNCVAAAGVVDNR